MKNKEFELCWDTYIQSLSDVTRKRAKPLKDCIERFESNGFDVSTMTYAESLILLNMLAEKRSYSSMIAYCAMFNGFLRTMTKVLNKSFQRLLPRYSNNNTQMYTAECHFLADIEERLTQLTDDVKINRGLTDSESAEYRKTWLSAVVLLILTFYGLSLEECRPIKMTDIDEQNRTIQFDRDGQLISRQLSETAFEYVTEYMHMTHCTHFWAHKVVVALPDTGYLFRRVRDKDSDSEIVTIAMLSSAKYQFTRKSKIKRWLGLSGAFISFPERVWDTDTLFEHVHNYLGEGVVADVNIKKHWHDFLMLETESERR
jgi:hypothetical protein